MNMAKEEVMVYGFTWVPWILIFPATVLLWSRKTRTIGLAGMAFGYTFAVLFGQLEISAILLIVGLMAAGLAVREDNLFFIKIIGHGLFLILAVSLRLHMAPGFHNPIAFDGIISPGAIPYRAYLNFDKTLSAIWIVYFISWLDCNPPLLQKIATGILFGVGVFAMLASIALNSRIVQIDPKLPAISWLWLFNNIILVCFAEEAFFRGYIQHGLARILHGHNWGGWVSLLVGSVLFSFSHMDHKYEMLLMYLIAGIDYGLAYQRAGLIGAMTAHAILNIGHFFFLTYPRLA